MKKKKEAKSILYVRGVKSKFVKELNKEAKKHGYKQLGDYLNELFNNWYEARKL